MGTNWRTVKFGDICKINNETYSISENWDFVNYLDTGNITKNVINEFQFISIKNDKLPSRARRKVKNGNIIYSTVRPNQEHYGYITSQPQNFLVSTGFAVIDVNLNLADSKFIYYNLTQREYTNLLQSIAEQSTTTYPSIKSIDIANLKISIPSLSVQKKIAAILSALDDKIELNEKINQNLEAQAQAIFKSWFVDFEPFGGKMPADWNIAELRAVCKTITKGTTPTTLKKAFVDKGVNFIKAESILSNHTIDLSKIMFIDDETNELLSRSQIKPFDILYTIAGTIGRFSMVMPTQIPANTNQAVAIIRCIDEYKFFIYNMFLCGCHTKYLTTKVVQAVQANLSLAAIGSLPIIQPSQDTLEKYLKLITPIFSAIFKNNEESRRLSQLRDTLLPKLMSGEIDVSDVAV